VSQAADCAAIQISTVLAASGPYRHGGTGGVEIPAPAPVNFEVASQREGSVAMQLPDVNAACSKKGNLHPVGAAAGASGLFVGRVRLG
jgi:hypothetical protein